MHTGKNMKDEPTTIIESPCIRNCCLNQEDICVGCFRSLEEILQWGAASNLHKQQILNSVENRKTTYNANRQ